MTRRATRPSMLATVALAVAVLLLAPITSASAAEPLPTGTYDVTVADDDFSVAVGEDGSVAVSGAEAFVVDLQFDEDGRVLDTFTVTAGDTVYEVEVDVADDGTYTTTVGDPELLDDGLGEGDGEEGDGDGEDGDGEDDGDLGEDEDDTEDGTDTLEEDESGEEDADGEHGVIVSTVARCAPKGLVARAAGWPNHGVVVRAAATGEPLVAEVTDPATGEVTALEADLSTLEGAEAFCAMVAETVPTAEEVREARAEQRAEAKAEREEARAERAEARSAAKAERSAGKADRSRGRSGR